MGEGTGERSVTRDEALYELIDRAHDVIDSYGRVDPYDGKLCWCAIPRGRSADERHFAGCIDIRVLQDSLGKACVQLEAVKPSVPDAGKTDPDHVLRAAAEKVMVRGWRGVRQAKLEDMALYAANSLFRAGMLCSPDSASPDMATVPRALVLRAIERLKLGDDWQDLPAALNLERALDSNTEDGP